MAFLKKIFVRVIFLNPYHALESDEAENSKILRVSAEERKDKVIPLRQRVGQVNLHENTQGKEFHSIVFSCFVFQNSGGKSRRWCQCV